MTLDQGCKLAEEYFAQMGEQGIRQILDTPEVWIMLPGAYGQVQCGSFTITVDKESGQIRHLRMPSKEGFALLKTAQEILVPEEYMFVEEEAEDGIQ